MRRRDRVRAAIVKLLVYAKAQDGEEHPQEFTDKEKAQIEDFTDLVIEFWDALTDKSY